MTQEEVERLLAQISHDAEEPLPEISRQAERLVEVAREAASKTAALPNLELERSDYAPSSIGPSRADFIPADMEPRYLALDEATGLPALSLRRVGDRLAVCPRGTDALYLNPKSAALRKLGIITTYIRGSQYQPGKVALRPGHRLVLVREPDNALDRHAVAVHRSLTSPKIGYVQRGRAPLVARRLDAGERLEAVVLRDQLSIIASTEVMRHMFS